MAITNGYGPDLNPLKSILQVGLSAVCLSRSGTADERAALLKETQQPMRFMRDADAHGRSNARSLSDRSPEPKRTFGTQVNSVQPLVDLQGSCKASRPSRQIRNFVGFAEPFHYVDSFQGLNGAQQHSCANSRFFRRNVEHVGSSIDEVDIGKSLVQKQALVAGCSSTIGMPTPIARGISLGLNNPAAELASCGLAHNGFPDEVSGQLRRITWQAGP